MGGALLVVAALFAGVSVLALLAARVGRAGPRATLEHWALGDRRLGTTAIWFLLGGSVYTAYTFVAVPGLVYGVGALGMFALAYTIVVWPIAFVVLPRLWTVAARNGCVTPADLVRARLGSPGLALAVALTGILATMPYVALQLVGIQAMLAPLGVPADGARGDLVPALAFGVLAVATYRSGLEAPRVISVVKGVLVFAMTALLVAVIAVGLGGPEAIFAGAQRGLAARPETGGSLLLPSELSSAYATLALGSALALLVYPHVTSCVFAARDAEVVRANCALLPAWTAVLGLLALLGLAAVAAGVQAPPGRAELGLPLLVADSLPPALAGLVLGALGIGALVPAAIMSVAIATLFTRNVYVEFLHPTATTDHQLQVARVVSALTKVGALAFVLGLRTQDAINLQLLGGVWILQTFPAVALALFTPRLHRVALLVGWAAGMLAGTALLAANGFVSVVPVSLLGMEVQVYAALLALGLNLALALGLSPLLDRLGVPRGIDSTGTEELARGTLPAREWLGTAR